MDLIKITASTLLIFTASLGAFAQIQPNKIEVPQASAFYSNGCKQGIAHEHPNGLCTNPAVGYSLVVKYPLGVTIDFTSLKVNGRKLNITTRQFPYTSADKNDFTAIVVTANESPLLEPPLRSSAHGNYLCYTINGRDCCDEIAFEMVELPTPPMTQ